MKRFFLTFFTFLSIISSTYADEGMWLPYLLDGKTVAEMQALGCKLSAEQIFDLNNSSLKDAILQFGGGCTAEMISPNGLLVTNHHCGIGQIQAHSSVDHDYLTDGFWAYSYGEELVNEGLSVLFLSYVEDVTEQAFKNVDDKLSYEEKNAKINENLSTLRKAIIGDRSVTVRIVPFYKGNQYIMFEYAKYSDVRLVACPPWGIGKYGADTDNWTWPRHKGDFCMFRIYTAPDGSPSDYSPDNIPMKTKRYLPISLKGVEEGDYAMIMGYPGSTDRYSSSQDVILTMDYIDPAVIACRTTKLNTYRKFMDEDQEVFIKYASKQAGVSNYWKYAIGQMKQLKNNKVVDKKIAMENEFTAWMNADPARKAKYGSVLKSFEDAMDILTVYQKPSVYLNEAGLNCCEAVALARSFYDINTMINEKADENEISKEAETLKSYVVSYFDDYDFDLDKAVAINMLNLYYKDVPSDMQPSVINKLGKKNNGNFSSYIDNAFNKSVFVSEERLLKWLDNPKSLDKDPIYFLRRQFINKNLQDIYPQLNEAYNLQGAASQLYMKALMEMQPNKIFYPDANFTMRLTYGTVESYIARDAVWYDYKTTLDGVMEKYVPGNWEFDLPEKLIELHKNKDYGRYADKDGNLIVNFITTNDITGGNSGSPVLDGEGNLIGIAFDGNWESMSGDISFEKKVQRTICVDARFFIFCVDKIGNAQNLLNEMDIIY